jgi:hypothetical protein
VEANKGEIYLSFRLALFAGGFGGGRTLCQSVVDGLIRPIVVSHEAKGIGFVELVDLVQVAARRVPNRLLGFALNVIHLLCRWAGETFLELFARRLVGGGRATGEEGVVVAAATVTVRGRGSGERWLRREWGPAPSPARLCDGSWER